MYHALAESQGGEFDPLDTGKSGGITSSAKKHLQLTCSKQGATDSSFHCYTYELWMAKTSLSLQKSVASEVVARSKKASGRQCTGSLPRDTFPDSVDTHFEVSG